MKVLAIAIISIICLISAAEGAQIWNPIVNITLPYEWDCVNGAIINSTFWFHCSNAASPDTPLFKVSPSMEIVGNYSVPGIWTPRDMHVSSTGQIYLLGKPKSDDKSNFNVLASFDQSGALSPMVSPSEFFTGDCKKLLVTPAKIYGIVNGGQSTLYSWDINSGAVTFTWIVQYPNRKSGYFKSVSRGPLKDTSVVIAIQENMQDILKLDDVVSPGETPRKIRSSRDPFYHSGTYLAACLSRDEYTTMALLDSGNGGYEMQSFHYSDLIGERDSVVGVPSVPISSVPIDIDSKFQPTDAICDYENDGIIATGVSDVGTEISQLGLFQINSNGTVLYQFTQTIANLSIMSWIRIHDDGHLTVMTGSKPAQFLVFDLSHTQVGTPSPSSPNLFTGTRPLDLLPIIILSVLILIAGCGLVFMCVWVHLTHTRPKASSSEPLQPAVQKSASITEKVPDPFNNSLENLMVEGPQYKVILSLYEGSRCFLYLGSATDEYIQNTHGKHLILKYIKQSRRRVNSFYREVKIMTALRNEARIVCLIGYTLKPHGLILKNYTLGSLIAYYTNKRNKISNKIVLEMMSELALAIEGIHKVGVTHAYIRPSNILLDQATDKKWKCVLTDFEYSIVHDNSILNLPQGVLSPEAPSKHKSSYTAPELLELDELVSEPVAIPSRDIYAFGMVLFGLILRKDPWKSTTPAQQEPS